jgi:hypothetical protein
MLFALAAWVTLVTSPVSLAQYAPQPDTAPNEVHAGTRILLVLDDPISTKDGKPGERIQLRTLEPVVAADGIGIGPGALVRAHIDKIQAAKKAGRARIWLTLDDIKTPNGWLPMVAEVFDVPGVHSVRVDYERDGEIESRTSTHQAEAAAAAAGAFVGASAGVAAGNGKDAAMGAAAGAAAAFMVTSGLGQELTLDKETKIEIILGRPLVFAHN